MLSRVAESLYWMSRYMERTDGILRMLKINYASSQDDVREFSWKPVLRLFTYADGEEVDLLEYNSREVLIYMVTDKENPNSILNLVTKARENARSVQDHITTELWQSLNGFYHIMREEQLARSLKYDDPVSALDSLIKQSVMYYGIINITMTRGEGYAFMNMGKYIERATQSANILDVRFGDAEYDEASVDPTYWKYLLLSISGYQLYLKTYRGGFEGKNIVEQIVLNIDFPRSILRAIDQLQQNFKRLIDEGHTDKSRAIEFMLGRLKSKLSYTTVDAIMQQGLHEYLGEVKSTLHEAGNALSRNYFAYA